MLTFLYWWIIGTGSLTEDQREDVTCHYGMETKKRQRAVMPFLGLIDLLFAISLIYQYNNQK